MGEIIGRLNLVLFSPSLALVHALGLGPRATQRHEPTVCICLFESWE